MIATSSVELQISSIGFYQIAARCAEKSDVGKTFEPGHADASLPRRPRIYFRKKKGLFHINLYAYLCVCVCVLGSPAEYRI